VLAAWEVPAKKAHATHAVINITMHMLLVTLNHMLS
jgi:hypothetical protein